MPEIIDRILKTQDVNNRRVFAGDPNGNVYGAAGSTCQDTVSGVLYVAKRDGMNAWEPLATVAQATPTSALIAIDPTSGATPGDFILQWSPASDSDALLSSPAGSATAWSVSNPANLVTLEYTGSGDLYLLLRGVPRIEQLDLTLSGIITTPEIDGLEFLSTVVMNSLAITHFPAVTYLPRLGKWSMDSSNMLTGNVNWPAGSMPVLDDFTVAGPLLSPGNIDSIYISLERATLASGGYAATVGSSQPTAASLDARNALIARGWTVLT